VEKIDFPKMQKILQLAYLVTWRFAQDPTPPLFVANPAPAHADTPKTGSVLAGTPSAAVPLVAPVAEQKGARE
jgi:hypothetical protein